jgi:hypothetical protein
MSAMHCWYCGGDCPPGHCPEGRIQKLMAEHKAELAKAWAEGYGHCQDSRHTAFRAANPYLDHG